MSQRIRILLIDDHSLFRESLRHLLEAEPDILVVGSFASTQEARTTLGRQTVDLTLLDYDSAEAGAGVVQNAMAAEFGGRILLITAGMSNIDIVCMLKRGVAGIFLKHGPPALLMKAIRQAVRGEVWLDSRGVRALVAGATAAPEDPRLHLGINLRERAVLSGVFEGLTNKEIADRLHLSENAVKWVLQQLFAKTGARVRSQLVRIILEKYGKNWLTTPCAGGS